MGYIIIRHYINEIDGDFHDLNASNFEKTVQKMKQYAAKNNKKLFFVSLANNQCIGLPLNCTPFAEVEYTESMTQEEKNKYVEWLKELSMDAEINGEYLEDFSTLTMVKFKKIDDEIVEIS